MVIILDICEFFLWFELLGEIGIDLVKKKVKRLNNFCFIYYIIYFFILIFECDFFFIKGNFILYIKKIFDFFLKFLFIRKINLFLERCEF